MESSVTRLWSRYQAENVAAPSKPVAVFHFCDNREDAQVCLQLVLAGQKRATAASVAELELSGDPFPQPGDLNVVTDFDGVAGAIIRTTAIEVKPFCEVDAEFARAEGEGDLTLNWWRKAHRAYFERILAESGVAVDDSLLVACERFELVMKA